jgi:hypothetical protein
LPTNVYFNQKVHSEANLYEDLVIESLRMYGIDVYYIPRSLVNLDNIMNEDIGSIFGSAYMIEMYLEDVDGFGGENTIMSKFGLEIRDTSNWVVSKRRWQQFVGDNDTTIINGRPNEGDLIYIPFGNVFHEIKFVEHEKPFYQLGNVHTYTLQCETFEFSHEKFNTGVESIDDVSDMYQYKQRVTVVNANTGPQFEKKERVRQLIGYDLSNDPIYMNGTVADVYYKNSNSTTEMYLFINEISRSDGKAGYFIVSGDSPNAVERTISGLSSGAEWLVVEAENSMIMRHDAYADNIHFEQEADEILDFSEINPFGEPGSYSSLSEPIVTLNTADNTLLTSDSITLTADIA